MQRIIVFITLLCFSSFGFSQSKNSPLYYVNPLMGTDSKIELSNGNTYPAVGLPWGMNLWTPQTNTMGHGWAYQYSADKIRGFKQTHQPSPWMNDYGQFVVMPGTGNVVFDQDKRASWYSHKAEKAQAHAYSVYLADKDVTFEMTPTERAANMRITFPESDSSYLIVDALDRGSYVKIIPEERKIVGYTTRYARGKLTNFCNYFVIQLSKDFSFTRLSDGKEIFKEGFELKGNHTGAIVGFRTKKGEQIEVKVASSFISLDQAQLNLSRELGGDSFEQTKAKAEKKWNEVLGRIEVKGGTEEEKRTFYSCLYRTVFFPNKLYEINAQNEIVHWSPYNGKVEKGKMFAGTGFWDTFRALYPFLNLMYPEINLEMQEGLANDYLEGGWLPEWSSPGYADIMIGNNSASVVADAYIKGVKSPQINTLYEALLHGANNEGPISAVGRKGVAYYNKLGFVPYNVGINENAARTLEYAYDDFTIYQLAKALNRPKSELDTYRKRALNYVNLFDTTVGFMRGKNEDGTFQSPFNPYKWGDAFTEGNSWHYTWSVFHDVAGLIRLMGGKQKFTAKLDAVFSQPPSYDDSYYGGMIHEIKEMQIANMGQYAHGNQPIQHMIYLYNYAGQPWKTQYWTREVMNRLYHATPDGYCGDEDNGQTSAWYVFSALGMYPVCPATNQYVLGSPLFEEITLNLSNGKKTVLKAKNNNSENRYVQSVQLNGKSHEFNWLSHDDLLKGGTILFEMGKTPNEKRGIEAGASPYSMSEE